MTIHVTAEHIARGKRRSCNMCPVALVIREAGFPMAEVGEDLFWFEPDGPTFPLPPEVELFMPAFDEGCPDLQPFSFEIPD